MNSHMPQIDRVASRDAGATAAPAARSAHRPGAAEIGIDAHSLVERRTGVATYVANLVSALGRIAPDEDIALYLHTTPPEPLPFPQRRVSPGPAWTSLRLSAHFASSPAPRAMLYPAHVLPLHSPARNVVTIHDLAYELFPSHFRWRDLLRLRWLTRSAVRRADHLIADSASTQRDLIERLGAAEDRVSVVHLGYDAEHFRPATADAVGAVHCRYGLVRPYIVAVGTLQSRKNHVRLIQSLRVLRDRGVDVDLVVCGAKGWLYDRIFATAKELKLQEHVRFLGFVEYDELPALYTGAAAGALVSLYEGFGLPVLEGLACGLPMLVSNVSSLPEVGGDAVLTCDPERVEQIACELDRLLHDTELRSTLGGRARDHLAGFSWERTARSTLRILKQTSSI